MSLRIFTDGGSRGNPGNAGIGVVVFRVSGENEKNIYELSEFIGTATNNEAEYQAILKALFWLASNNKENQEVDFYLDSKLVIEQINKNWKIKDSRMANFAKEAWGLIDKFQFKTRFTHVRREKNQEADRLVNQALDAHQE